MPLDEATEFYTYDDSHLSVLVPKYLRPKKGMTFFAPRSKKDGHHCLLHFCVDFPPAGTIRAFFDALKTKIDPADDAKSFEWMGVQQQLLRRGKAAYLSDAVEGLSTTFNPLNGERFYDYSVFMTVGARTVSLTFMGQGKLDEFEALVKEIVKSVRMKM